MPSLSSNATRARRLALTAALVAGATRAAGSRRRAVRATSSRSPRHGSHRTKTDPRHSRSAGRHFSRRANRHLLLTRRSWSRIAATAAYFPQTGRRSRQPMASMSCGTRDRRAAGQWATAYRCDGGSPSDRRHPKIATVIGPISERLAQTRPECNGAFRALHNPGAAVAILTRVTAIAIRRWFGRRPRLPKSCLAAEFDFRCERRRC